MILGVDVGTRTFGWAIVAPRTGRVLALGELFQDGGDDASAGAANTRRVRAQVQLLDRLVAKHRVTTIAGEARSLGGPPQARVRMAAAQSCCWGGLAALAELRGLALVEAAPKLWQLAVLGRSSGKVDYDEVAAALGAFVDGPAAAQLLAIPASRRNHALDAAGTGILVAVRPGEATQIA